MVTIHLICPIVFYKQIEYYHDQNWSNLMPFSQKQKKYEYIYHF